MRIVDVVEITKPIASPIRNAYIDFSKMTASLRRGGDGCGARRVGASSATASTSERPLRAGRADPRALPRPHPRSRARKPARRRRHESRSAPHLGRHDGEREAEAGMAERSVAVGTLDMAVWDAVAKIAGKPLFRLLAERNGRAADPRVFVYAAGGYYYPGKDNAALRAEMRGYLRRGYTVVKMKIGGAAIDEDRARIEAVLREIGAEGRLAVDANGRFDLETGIAYAKMLRDYPLFWFEEIGDPLDYARQAAMGGGIPIRARWRPARECCSRTRTPATSCATAACGPIATGCSSTARCPTGSSNICARSTCWPSTAGPRRAASRMAATRCRSTSRPASASAATRATLDLFQPLWRLPRLGARGRRPHRHAGAPRHRLRGQGRSDQGDAGIGGVGGWHPEHGDVMPRACAASSSRRPADVRHDVRWLLDRAPPRAMTAECRAWALPPSLRVPGSALRAVRAQAPRSNLSRILGGDCFVATLLAMALRSVRTTPARSRRRQTCRAALQSGGRGHRPCHRGPHRRRDAKHATATAAATTVRAAATATAASSAAATWCTAAWRTLPPPPAGAAAAAPPPWPPRPAPPAGAPPPAGARRLQGRCRSCRRRHDRPRRRRGRLRHHGERRRRGRRGCRRRGAPQIRGHANRGNRMRHRSRRRGDGGSRTSTSRVRQPSK